MKDSKPFEARHPMPAEDVAKLTYMKQFASPEGQMGFMLTDSPEAVSWYQYYKLKRPLKAKALKARILADKQYMVPAQWPEWFDRSFAPIRKPTEVSLREPKGDLTPEAHARILAMFERLKQRWAEPEKKSPPESQKSAEEILEEKGKALAEAFRTTDFSKLMVKK
jgi:hypothetical protein